MLLKQPSRFFIRHGFDIVVFHGINYLGSCCGGLVLSPRRMAGLMDLTIRALTRRRGPGPARPDHALPYPMGLRSPKFSGHGKLVVSRCQVLFLPFQLHLIRGSIPERGVEPDLIVA